MNFSTCSKWFGKTMLAATAFVLGSAAAFAQTKTVRGTVLDNFGETVIGANVVIVGTQEGTMTDADGNFTLNNVPQNGTLRVSYIGYATQEIPVSGKSVISITLKEDNTTLEDVVVVGYGTMRRKDLTGSVASISGENLVKLPVANVAEALSGKLPGVNIVQQDGRPGAEMSIRVRGGGSITQSNDPLFIVDGIAVSSIDDIPADQIESIDVLKDASSTAIYGARGANGVILVTTKSAKEGKAQVKYNMYYQIKAKPETLDLQDAYTYVRRTWEYMTAVGYGDNMARYYGLGTANGNHLNEYKNVASHNYMDDVFRTSHAWNHDLSISGGTDKTKYFASVNYTDDEATMEKAGYSRWNVNLKLQQAINSKLKLNLDARYSETKTQNNKYFSSNTATMNNTLVYPWQFNMIDNPLGTGNLPEFGEGDVFANPQYNPIDVINDNDYVKKQQRVRLNSSLTWEIIKGLTAKTELGVSRHWSKTENWQGAKTGRDLVAIAQLGQGDGYNTSWTTTLNYDFADLIKSDDHSLNLLLGNEVLGSRSNSNSMRGYQYPTTWSKETAFGQMQMAQDHSKSYFSNTIGVSSHTTSWFGRLNYNLFSRYMFTFTMRADGSSKFAEGNRWGYFPAGAIAWRISDEPFLAGNEDWLDNLKLRLSFGTSGNDGIDASAFIDEWVSSLNDDGTFSYKPGTLKGNADLTWEKTTSRNIGLDYGFLNGKFNGSFDFYWNTTKDCLMRVPINSIAGYSYEFRNAAETSNKGIEVSFNYNIVRAKDFDLNFGITYNYNVNKVEKVPADANMDGSMRFASTSMMPSKPYVIEEGEPVGLIKGFKAAGFYTVDDFDVVNGVWTLKEGILDTQLTTYHGSENYKLADGQRAFPGMPKYENTNGDDVIDANDAVIIGRMMPKHTGGFNLSGRYKDFDFSANFSYQLDGKVFNANAARSVHSGNNTKWSSQSRLSTKFDNSWRMYNINGDGDLYAVTDPDELRTLNAGAQYGLLSYISNDAPVVSDDYVENAAFLRMQSLTIGYTVPKNLVKKVGISNARIYFTAGNLFCISGYDGLDPEVSTNSAMDSNYSGFPTPGFDYNSYPKSRTFTFGLNVAF